jgi:hypothetical protein
MGAISSSAIWLAQEREDHSESADRHVAGHTQKHDLTVFISIQFETVSYSSMHFVLNIYC